MVLFLQCIGKGKLQEQEEQNNWQTLESLMTRDNTRELWRGPELLYIPILVVVTLFKWQKQADSVAHTYNPGTHEMRQEDYHGFEVSLIYKVNTRPAIATQQNSILKEIL